MRRTRYASERRAAWFSVVVRAAATVPDAVAVYVTEGARVPTAHVVVTRDVEAAVRAALSKLSAAALRHGPLPSRCSLSVLAWPPLGASLQWSRVVWWLTPAGDA